MAGKTKMSKTNVAARADERRSAHVCKYCGQPVQTAMVVPTRGKKRLVRLCCTQ